MAAKKLLVVGVDLGGSKMLGAVLSGDYKVIGEHKAKTRAEQGSEHVYQRLLATIRAAVRTAGIAPAQLGGIGVGFPGPVDFARGVVLHAPNLGIKNWPLRKLLEEEFHVPVVVDNDVNAGTYAEYHFGAARGYRHVVGIFPGTGIGGGLVLDGKLYRGGNGCAGEVGHQILAVGGPLCGCGQRGCLEALASRATLSKEAAALAARGDAPELAGIAGTDVTHIRSRVLAQAIEEGDTHVHALVMHTAWYLGIGMANIVNLLGPELIVLGGGLVEAMPKEYVKTAEKSMRQHCMRHVVREVRVATAQLKDEAVVMGAARLCREAMGHEHQKSK